MSEDKTSQSQHRSQDQSQHQTQNSTQSQAVSWKEIVEQQMEFVDTVSQDINQEMARLRRIGFDKTVENIEKISEVSKNAMDQVRTGADFMAPFDGWQDLMFRQMEVAVRTSKAWNEAALDNAKRVSGWMTRSF